MPSSIGSLTLLLSVLMVGLSAAARGADRLPAGQNVFGNSSTEIDVSLGDITEATVTWSLTAGRAGAVLRRGERVHSGPKPLNLMLEFPDVAPGTVLPAQLRLQFRSGGRIENEVREFLVFPREVATLRQAWLKSLNIELVDPQRILGPHLESVEIPWKPDREVRARSENPGLQIVVVSGNEAQRLQLWRRSLAAARSGQRILVLGGAGTLLPQNDLPGPADDVEHLTWMRNSLIRACDHRLDDRTWPSPATLNACSAHASVRRGQAVVEIRDDATGWAALEVQYSHGGHLIWAGYGIVESWEATPAARYLLLGLLERLSADRNHKGESHELE